MQLRDYQLSFIEAVERGWGEFKKQLGVAPTGCHDPAQPILLWNGRIIPAKSVQVGDLLMGFDGTPRRVLALHSGMSEMIHVIPTKGDPFIVTADHPLTLIRTNDGSRHEGRLVDIRVKDWMRWNKTKKHIHKLIRFGVDFPSPPRTVFSISDDPIAPYLIGVMLGDGCMRDGLTITSADIEIVDECNRLLSVHRLRLVDSGSNSSGAARMYCIRDSIVHQHAQKWFRGRLTDLGLNWTDSGNKFIPDIYLRGSRSARLEVLAGLMDTDGSLRRNGFDYISKSEKLAKDVAFISRSLGLAAYVSQCSKSCQTGACGIYWRVGISGDCSIIPCRLPRKRSGDRCQKKDVLRTGFTVQEIGPGFYNGFTVDGDNRYLLGDFTLTHNSGKTIIFSWLAKRLFDKTGKKTLILAHREELIDQAITKLHAATGIIADKEKAEFSARLTAPVVVASVQTMIRRLDKWPSDHFGLVVADEAHHVLADSWRKVLEHFNGNTCKLGVTATPDRGDKRNLGEFFENIAHEIKLLDLIKSGYLCPITIRSLPIKIDLTQVSSIAGDLDSGELGSIIEPYLGQIATEIKANVGNRNTLCFLPLISTSNKFVDHCRAVGINAKHVDGESSDRQDILKSFANGEFQLLSNAMLLTEGYDCPDISCIVVLRPTRSRPLYAQMCLDCETEILTDHGWRQIDDHLYPDEKAASFHQDGSVCFQPIIQTIRRHTVKGESFVELENPHLSIRVTNEHDLVLRQRRGRARNRTPWFKKTAEEALELNDLQIPVAGLQWAPGVDLTDNELRFIGLVLTDGNMNPATNAITLYQSERYPAVMEYIEEVLRGCGFKFGHCVSRSPTNFGERSFPLHRWFVSKGKPRGTHKDKRGWSLLEPFLDKDWPDQFERLTREQLLIVLEAMNAGDGVKRVHAPYTPRTLSICTANHVLANRLQSICVRRGIRCNLGVAGTEGKMIMLLCSPDRPVWGLPTSASDTRPILEMTPARNEPVWCISVPSGMIITRRHGKVAVLGNCGRGTRIATGKENLLLLDFLWLHERHSIVHPANLIAGSQEEADEMTALSQEDMDSGGEEMDLLQMAGDVAAQREAALKKKLEAMADRKAKFISAEEFALRYHKMEIAEFEPVVKWHFDDCTPKQVEWLEKAGVDPGSVKGKGQASAILDVFFKERGKEPASHKQCWVMSRAGWRSKDGLRGPFEATRDDAKEFFARRNAAEKQAQPELGQPY